MTNLQLRPQKTSSKQPCVFNINLTVTDNSLNPKDIDAIKAEMISVSTSDKPLYFLRPANVELAAFEKRGKKIAVDTYVILENVSTSKSYVPLGPSESSSAPYRLLAGCDQDAFKEINEDFRGEGGKKGAESNPFVKWGTACLAAKRAGTYQLTFQLKNPLVVVSSTQPNFQTAVGTIRSEPLTISLMTKQ